MVAEALEVSVVSRALLLAIGLAHGTVHVEDQFTKRLVLMRLVNPLTRKVHQRRQVAALAEYLGLEASHDAHGSGFVVRLRCAAAHNMAHGRIDRQSLGIVHVFVTSQSAINGLPQQGQKQVLLVRAQARISQQVCARLREPQRFIEFAVGQQSSIRGDLTAAEIQLQATVETNPQIIVFRVTHWVPLSAWQMDGPNPCFSRA